MSLIGKPDENLTIWQVLEDSQQVLWGVGADLSRVSSLSDFTRTPADAASRIEPLTDHYHAKLPDLRHFILRGGS